MSSSLWPYGLGILQTRIQVWVAFPFSRESSQPRSPSPGDGTQVSRIAGRFFTNWAIREALFWKWYSSNPWNHTDNQFRRENAIHGSAALSAHPLCCAVLSHSVVSNSLWPHDCSPPGSSVHGDSPGKNIGEGCHALLQGIFPVQGLNPHLPHCRQILYHLSHQGSPSMKWTTCESV